MCIVFSLVYIYIYIFIFLQAFHSIAKCVAALAMSCPSEGESVVNQFVRDIQVSSDAALLAVHFLWLYMDRIKLPFTLLGNLRPAAILHFAVKITRTNQCNVDYPYFAERKSF